MIKLQNYIPIILFLIPRKRFCANFDQVYFEEIYIFQLFFNVVISILQQFIYHDYLEAFQAYQVFSMWAQLILLYRVVGTGRTGRAIPPPPDFDWSAKPSPSKCLRLLPTPTAPPNFQTYLRPCFCMANAHRLYVQNVTGAQCSLFTYIL